MTILGISSSAIVGGNVDRMVRAVINGVDRPAEFINLSRMTYGPCRACAPLCAGDNRCKIDDDLSPLYEKIVTADALVLGSPTYHSDINGFMRIFLERLWGLRHQRFPIKRKPFAVVTAGLGEAGAQGAGESVKKRMAAYQAECIGSIAFASGIYPCFDCGFGETCRVGAYYRICGEDGLDRLKAEGPTFNRWEDSPAVKCAIQSLIDKLNQSILPAPHPS